uniref:Putative secreted protein n=1 Tax=Anopheles marajoara TaxID=58244 RepID=A0A2M4CFF7_9DIPT
MQRAHTAAAVAAAAHQTGTAHTLPRHSCRRPFEVVHSSIGLGFNFFRALGRVLSGDAPLLEESVTQ